MDNEERLPEGVVRIPLDGTYGAGPDCELTLVVKTADGRQQESTYTVPYMCLDMRRIQSMCDINLLLGFKVVKNDARPTGLKELGL